MEIDGKNGSIDLKSMKTRIDADPDMIPDNFAPPKEYAVGEGLAIESARLGITMSIPDFNRRVPFLTRFWGESQDGAVVDLVGPRSPGGGTPTDYFGNQDEIRRPLRSTVETAHSRGAGVKIGVNFAKIAPGSEKGKIQRYVEGITKLCESDRDMLTIRGILSPNGAFTSSLRQLLGSDDKAKKFIADSFKNNQGKNPLEIPPEIPISAGVVDNVTNLVDEFDRLG